MSNTQQYQNTIYQDRSIAPLGKFLFGAGYILVATASLAWGMKDYHFNTSQITSETAKQHVSDGIVAVALATAGAGVCGLGGLVLNTSIVKKKN